MQLLIGLEIRRGCRYQPASSEDIAMPWNLRKIVPLAVTALFISSTFISAATYYVDNGHGSASDANPGTESAPWITIQQGVSGLQPGDTLYVKNGVYNEQVSVSSSGSVDNYVTITAYQSRGATIDGSGLQIPEYRGLVEISGRQYVRFSGFRVINSGPTGTSSGIQVEDSENVTIHGNYTHNTASSGIIFWDSASVTIDANEVEKALSGGATSENEGITVGETDGFEICNNYVHDGNSARGEGIDAKDGSTNGSVHHNHVHHMQGVGIYVDAWDKATGNIDVYANRVHDINGDGIAIGSEQGGRLDNIRIFNNIIYDNLWTGIDLHACCISQHPVHNVQIVNNTVVANGRDPWGGGIYIENDQAAGVTIRNNIVSDNLSFQILLEGNPPADAQIDYNLIHGFRNEAGETYGDHYQLGDPLFSDPAIHDYRLQTGSPAIDTGVAVQFVSTDGSGNNRPQGNGYDIGAFEYTADGRVDISGRVQNEQGTPLCALVLANGQHMFSCAGQGEYSLSVPLDDQGQITLQTFATGFSPFRQVLTPAEAATFTVTLARAQADKTLSVDATITTRDNNRATISGAVLVDSLPVCALVLANGQHMFSCAGQGEYSLDVPLDDNGEITLFVFAAGFEPYRNIILGGSRSQQLDASQTWMYQIQDLDQNGAVDALAATDYPLLVLEPGHNFTDFTYDTSTMISALRSTPQHRRRLLLAYVDIGQAEDYRDYWEPDWVAPTETSRGNPDFLVTIDPDGWSGNYPVAYWDPRWKSIWLGTDGIVAELARMGFDGIYLDWVEAYDDDAVIAAALAASVEPAVEMIAFVEELGAAGRAVTADFLVIPQNAPYLIDSDPDRYSAAIDALAVEDTWFHGAGDADWNDPQAGDLHDRHDGEWSTANRLQQYRQYLDRRLPVFSVDYCISTVNAAQVYQDARTAGMRPLVTRVSLSRLTETPPDQY